MNQDENERLVRESTNRELRRVIVEANECVRITQERSDTLERGLDDAIGKLASALYEISEARKVEAFGFLISKDETLQQGMARNYHEFNEERVRLTEQIEILKREIKGG